MQLKQTLNRKQILNLLNIDNLIEDYLGLPSRKKALTSSHNHNIGSSRTQNQKQPAKKLKICYSQTPHSILMNTDPYQQHNIVVRTQRAVVSSKNFKKTFQDRSLSAFGHKAPICRDRRKLVLKGDKYACITQSDVAATTVESNLNDIVTYSQTVQNDSIQKRKLGHAPQSITSNSTFHRKNKTVSCPKLRKTDISLGVVKNRYQLLKVIGRGLSGIVYKARDILSKRFIAIKVISVNAKQYYFTKEIHHKNIVEYYNSFIEHGKRYLVLQYFPMTLQTLLKKHKLNQYQIRHLFRQIVDGVVYLHGISIAHRDIKLDNIVVSADMTLAKFIDFGLCTDGIGYEYPNGYQTNEQDMVNACKQFCGTPNYIPPQIISNIPYDPKKSDIWSLGVLLYTMAVGRYPFQGRDQNDTYNKIKTKRVLFPKDISNSLKTFIIKMLNKDPEGRPTILDILKQEWVREQQTCT